MTMVIVPLYSVNFYGVGSQYLYTHVVLRNIGYVCLQYYILHSMSFASFGLGHHVYVCVNYTATDYFKSMYNCRFKFALTGFICYLTFYICYFETGGFLVAYIH